MIKGTKRTSRIIRKPKISIKRFKMNMEMIKARLRVIKRRRMRTTWMIKTANKTRRMIKTTRDMIDKIITRIKCMSQKKKANELNIIYSLQKSTHNN